MLWIKWTALVWANAIVGLVFANLGSDWSYNFGMILWVCVFIPIYVMIDTHAIKTNNSTLQQSLLIGVIIRALTQSIVVVDMYAGMVAMSMINTSAGGLFVGFALTVITGGVLSTFVAVLTGFLMLLISMFKNKKSNH